MQEIEENIHEKTIESRQELFGIFSRTKEIRQENGEKIIQQIERYHFFFSLEKVKYPNLIHGNEKRKQSILFFIEKNLEKIPPHWRGIQDYARAWEREENTSQELLKILLDMEKSQDPKEKEAHLLLLKDLWDSFLPSAEEKSDLVAQKQKERIFQQGIHLFFEEYPAGNKNVPRFLQNILQENKKGTIEKFIKDILAEKNTSLNDLVLALSKIGILVTHRQLGERIKRINGNFRNPDHRKIILNNDGRYQWQQTRHI